MKAHSEPDRHAAPSGPRPPSGPSSPVRPIPPSGGQAATVALAQVLHEPPDHTDVGSMSPPAAVRARLKAIRLARINPGLLRRLEDGIPEDEAAKLRLPQGEDSSENPACHKSMAAEWTPLPLRGTGGAWYRPNAGDSPSAQLHLSMPRNHPESHLERGRSNPLLEGLFLSPDSGANQRSQLRFELEVLRRRCGELEDALWQLRRQPRGQGTLATAAAAVDAQSRRSTASPGSPRRGPLNVESLGFPSSWAWGSVNTHVTPAVQLAEALRRAALAEGREANLAEELRACAAALQDRDAGRAAQAAATERALLSRLAQMEESLSQAENKALAADSAVEEANAAAAAALAEAQLAKRRTRKLALQHGEHLVAALISRVTEEVFHAWHEQLISSRLAETERLRVSEETQRATAEAAATAAYAAAHAAEAAALAASAEAAAARDRAMQAEERLEGLLRPRRRHAETDEEPASPTSRALAQRARERALKGGVLWVVGTERSVAACVIRVWRSLTITRRSVSSMQAKLFAEEASRSAALHALRLELSMRLAEAEARHQSAIRRLRAELAEAEARQLSALTVDADAVQRAIEDEADLLEQALFSEADDPSASSDGEEEFLEPSRRADRSLWFHLPSSSSADELQLSDPALEGELLREEAEAQEVLSSEQ